MRDFHTHFIFALSKLHTGGVAAVATATSQQRSNLFAALAGKRPIPLFALEKMSQFLRVEAGNFCESVIEPWLVRDDADLATLEHLGAEVTVLARIQSSAEKGGGTAQKHYFLLKVTANGSERYAIARMRPSVSEALQRRKGAKDVPAYIVDYRRLGLLHRLVEHMDTDAPLASFARAVIDAPTGRPSEAAQRALDLALEKAVMPLSEQQDYIPYSVSSLLDPTLLQQLTQEIAQKLYVLKILDAQLAESVGKTGAGRPVTVKIMHSAESSIYLSDHLIRTRPQHLLLFGVYKISGLPVFEVAFDGPFEEVLKLKDKLPLASQDISKLSNRGGMEIQMKSLRLMNDGVAQEDRLLKR